jgi:hypothetical protein
MAHLDSKLCTALESKFNAITFGRFLRRLLKHRGSGKRMVVVLHNAKYHHAGLLQPWLEQHQEVLTLPATIQPRIQSHRTGVEACSTPRHPQPVFPNLGQSCPRSLRMLCIMGKSKPAIEQAMRHYLSPQVRHAVISR